jgi:hypothetical protein
VALVMALALLMSPTTPLTADEPTAPSEGSHGTPRRHVLQGLLIGAGAGAVLGFELHHCPPADNPNVGPCPTFAESMAGTALVLGAVGAGVGFIIRTDTRADRRQAVGAIGIVPRRRGVAIAASVRF